MAEARSVSGKQLVCSICQKTFTEMMVSSCFHTFCLDCLEREISRYSGANYSCPICRTAVTLPHDVMRSLKTDGYSAHNLQQGQGQFDSAHNKVCDICSNGYIATSRCLQCEENLCQTCTNAHLKMKASRYHRQHVIPLQGQNDPNYSVDSERSRSERYCWRHRGEEIQFVCKECNVILCLICKLLEHENHVTKPISEEAKEVRGQLNKLMQKSMSHGEHLHVKVQELETKQAKYPLELGQQLNKLNYQASQLHSEIEEEKKKTEIEIKSHYGNYLSKYEVEGQHLRKDYDEYRSVNMEALKLLNSNDDVIVVEKGKGLGEKLDRIDKEFISSSKAVDANPSKKFEYGTIDTHQIHTMMGRIRERPSTHQIQPRHTQDYHAQRSMSGPGNILVPQSTSRSSTHISYRSPGPGYSTQSSTRTDTAHLFTVPTDDAIGYVYGIAPTGNTQAWVSLLDHRRLTLMSCYGDIVSTVDVGDVCEDICSDMNGGCYVTCPQARAIKHVTAEGEVFIVQSDLPDVPHGICMGQLIFERTEDQQHNELYVCCTELSAMNASMYGSKKGCVRIFGENGEELEQWFNVQAPVRIDVHSGSSTLCISDHSNGCVIVADSTGQFVKALYTGEDENESFKPLGVCFDGHGNIVIADWHNDCVSLVGQEGDLIKHVHCDVQGPQSVAVTDSTLWVGGKSGTIQVCKLD